MVSDTEYSAEFVDRDVRHNFIRKVLASSLLIGFFLKFNLCLLLFIL